MPSRNLSLFSRNRNQFGLDPLMDLHREMNRLFNDVFTGGTLADVRGGSMFSAPKVDVHEKDGELCVIAELPGVTQQDVDLQLDGDVLTIRGEKKNESEQENTNYYMMERSYGHFERAVQLPFAPKPEEVKANFENGVLTIRMPKAESQRAHRIELNAPQEQKQAKQASLQSGTKQAQAGDEQKRH